MFFFHADYVSKLYFDNAKPKMISPREIWRAVESMRCILKKALMSVQAALEHFSVAEQKAISSLPESLDFTEQLKNNRLCENRIDS